MSAAVLPTVETRQVTAGVGNDENSAKLWRRRMYNTGSSTTLHAGERREKKSQERMSAQYFAFSLWPTRNIDKTRLRRINFSMFLSNHRVKSLITKNIENNILEGTTYRFYILFCYLTLFSNFKIKKIKSCKFN